MLLLFQILSNFYVYCTHLICAVSTQSDSRIPSFSTTDVRGHEPNERGRRRSSREIPKRTGAVRKTGSIRQTSQRRRLSSGSCKGSDQDRGEVRSHNPGHIRSTDWGKE